MRFADVSLVPILSLAKAAAIRASMTRSAPRYALYAAPAPDDQLWHLGSAAIGYDAAEGADIAFPQGAPFDRPDWRTLTEEPRRYGFHGTLKAPFTLAEGIEESDFLEAVALFAARRAVVAVPALDVALIGGFVALVPAQASAPLSALATDCVRDLDAFRAPLSAADRERRLKSPLTGRQIAQLDAWGYPYIFEDFRFHMTLTGSLPQEDRVPVREALAAAWEAHRAPFRLDGLSVFRQEEREGRFAVIARFPFAA